MVQTQLRILRHNPPINLTFLMLCGLHANVKSSVRHKRPVRSLIATACESVTKVKRR
jgi:hypothetical protein